MKLLNILLQAEVSQGGSGMTSTLILVILMILIGVIVFFIVNKQKKINELETQLAKKNSKINQLEEQLAEKENDKVFKIKDDGTIVRVDETCPDNNGIIFCPYCGKKLK